VAGPRKPQRLEFLATLVTGWFNPGDAPTLATRESGSHSTTHCREFRVAVTASAIEWRALRPADIPGAFNLSRIAGWNQTEADWLGYLAFDPAGCLAAVIDGQLAGTATSIRFGEGIGWIGMILVHPAHRRLGIGSALLKRTIQYLRDLGTMSIRLDATATGRKVYLPLGFRDEYDVMRFEGSAPGVQSGPVPAAPPTGAGQMNRGDLAQIVKLDTQAFGADRASVLTALGGRDPGLCFVVRNSEGILGYLIAREGREAIQLGPFVALSSSVADQLLAALFRAAPGRRIFVDVPVPNQEARELIAAKGFTPQRQFTRMILGESGPADHIGLVFGTSGAEKG
jgi:GNAT superfamily N-acetyltransferase